MPYGLPPGELDKEVVFECALKREGFLRTDGQAAEPDWRRFGKSIQGRFQEVRLIDFRDAVRTLVKQSPRKQIVRDGMLRWKDIQRTKRESEEEFVLHLVKTVRNNLFHGGKYPDGPIAEVARDKRILVAALKVLDGCRELHPGIARWAQEAA